MEFERHAAGGSNMQYFDFLVKLKTEQEHLFRNIQRNEYHNLFEFVRYVELVIFTRRVILFQYFTGFVCFLLVVGRV